MKDEITVEFLKEKIPCGESVTTTYIENGVVIRQDVDIHVSAEAMRTKVGTIA